MSDVCDLKTNNKSNFEFDFKNDNIFPIESPINRDGERHLKTVAFRTGASGGFPLNRELIYTTNICDYIMNC